MKTKIRIAWRHASICGIKIGFAFGGVIRMRPFISGQNKPCVSRRLIAYFSNYWRIIYFIGGIEYGTERHELRRT